MSAKKGSFIELLFKIIMPKVYGFGAAIVIVGAMFKILHLPGAALMLGVGLTTEAVIFILSAFEPPHKEIDWSLVYPELSDEHDDAHAKKKPIVQQTPATPGVAAQMDKLMSEANVGPDLIKSLGDGMRNLSNSAKNLSSLGSSAEANNEFTSNLKVASQSLVNVNKSYNQTIQAVNEFAESARSSQGYTEEVKKVTKSLSALNALYELELKDSQAHTKALSKFYSNLTSALEGMADVGKQTESFQTEITKLTGNINSLNKVYGGMLAAMKSTT